jgi:hypothetical protein
MKLTACFTEYGVYDLNRFFFIFFRDNETGEDYDPNSLHLYPQRKIAKRPFALNLDQIFIQILK